MAESSVTAHGLATLLRFGAESCPTPNTFREIADLLDTLTADLAAARLERDEAEHRAIWANTEREASISAAKHVVERALAAESTVAQQAGLNDTPEALDEELYLVRVTLRTAEDAQSWTAWLLELADAVTTGGATTLLAKD